MFAVGALSLSGCGRTGDDSERADTEVQHEISETEPKSMEVQTDTDTDQPKNDEQEQGRTGSPPFIKTLENYSGM